MCVCAFPCRVDLSSGISDPRGLLLWQADVNLCITEQDYSSNRADEQKLQAAVAARLHSRLEEISACHQWALQAVLQSKDRDAADLAAALRCALRQESKWPGPASICTPEP